MHSIHAYLHNPSGPYIWQLLLHCFHSPPDAKGLMVALATNGDVDKARNLESAAGSQDEHHLVTTDFFLNVRKDYAMKHL